MISIQKVNELVLDAIKHEKPYSLIRIGDGEGRILMWPNDISRNMLNKHLIYWFGYPLQDRDVARIQWLLRMSIWNADIIGLQNNPKNRYWAKATELTKKLLDEKTEARPTASLPRITDINIHKDMWFENVFEGWLKKANRVALITCRNGVTKHFKTRYNPKVLKIITIPEEYNTGKKATDFFNVRYKQVKNIIQKETQYWLYLIGGGVLGKSLCRLAKEAGSVAIDIGSVFDGWAGVPSRSFLRNNLEDWRLEIGDD